MYHARKERKPRGPPGSGRGRKRPEQPRKRVITPFKVRVFV